MIDLFIDTSIKYITISVIESDDIIYTFHEKIMEDLSVKILSIIDNALKKTNKNVSDINKIYVVNGPGSFTGIRIGLTIVKVLAWSLNISVIPVSSLELIATTEVNKDYIVPCIDARRENGYLGLYDKDLNIIKNDQFCNINDFLKKNCLKDNYVLVTYDDINVENRVFPNINIIKIVKKHKNDKSVNPHLLNPNYLKNTEAEEKLKHDKKN